MDFTETVKSMTLEQVGKMLGSIAYIVMVHLLSISHLAGKVDLHNKVNEEVYQTVKFMKYQGEFLLPLLLILRKILSRRFLKIFSSNSIQFLTDDHIYLNFVGFF